MIYFLTRYYKGTIDGFIDSWANDLRPHVRVVRYRQLPFHKPDPAGVYVFADLEKVRSWEMYLARKFFQRLKAEAPNARVLNDPEQYPGKFESLKTWRREGINDFQAYRLDELAAAPLKFPVFLRRDSDHRGAMGGLISSRAELDQALSRLSLRDRLQKKHLMVVEYCDCTGPDGVFRKYSAMCVGSTVVPSHLYFSKGWVTKTPELATETLASEEAAFVDRFPHGDVVAKAFHLARLEYGRVDYGVKDGRVQVWEINTNPIIVRRREVVHALRIPSQTKAARFIADALLALRETPANGNSGRPAPRAPMRPAGEMQDPGLRA